MRVSTQVHISLLIAVLFGACGPTMRNEEFGASKTIVVRYARFYNGATWSQAKTALDLMAKVLAHDRFKKLVEEGPRYVNGASGYAPASKCGGVENAPIDGVGVFARIQGAAEISINGTSLGGDQGVLDLRIRARVSSPWSIGATGGGVIRTNHRFIKRASPVHLAAHWLHEYMHMLGYCDGGVESQSPFLVSYWVGYAACVAGATIKKEADPEKSCLSSLGPGFTDDLEPVPLPPAAAQPQTSTTPEPPNEVAR